MTVADEHRWRDPLQVTALWEAATGPDPGLLRGRVTGRFWDVLAELDATLLVTREYEHLVLALSATGGRGGAPLVTYLTVPHPSGLAVSPDGATLHLASTRNPNQLLELRPAAAVLPRADVRSTAEQLVLERRPLLPIQSTFLPGSHYLHDLAFVGGRLHGNLVGSNSVARFDSQGGYERVWWPLCVERAGRPRLERNYIQLNSIAAGKDLEASYFSASSDSISSRRPSHQNYPVDRRGVIFSGATREPVVRGLTRPHSARLHGGDLWVANSGYGELLRVTGERTETVRSMPGWTRGLCFRGRYAFVGTSRVLPRFRQYAPGLELEKSTCAVHAVDLEEGAVAGSVTWPDGNQIFALELMAGQTTRGLPFTAGTQRPIQRERELFYAFALCKETHDD